VRAVLFSHRVVWYAERDGDRLRIQRQTGGTMTITNRKRIINADGHVAEDSAAIIAHMPQPYRDKAREQPFSPFPPFDHLHAGHLVDMPPGAFNRKVGCEEWLAFLNEVGLEAAVPYPTAGVASSNIVNPDWAIDAARAYNDWLSESYLKRSPRFRGLALLPQPALNPRAAADELRRAVADLGMCGAVIPSNSLHAPPLGNPVYAPVYEAANEIGVLCCHPWRRARQHGHGRVGSVCRGARDRPSAGADDFARLDRIQWGAGAVSQD
jgi:predicted TIM-barrel fold metal-dependent hydrolase